MRYRKLSADGDYTFGQSQGNFFIDDQAVVAQSIRTRLLLMRGEWFLDKTEGTPYGTAILGAHTKPFYDMAIQERILRTDGVTEISNYSSNLDPTTRKLTVTATVKTVYGPIQTTGVF